MRATLRHGPTARSTSILRLNSRDDDVIDQALIFVTPVERERGSPSVPASAIVEEHYREAARWWSLSRGKYLQLRGSSAYNFHLFADREGECAMLAF